jgi:DNA polymerase I-like protein with 3'-5' exonuclease and polymerase domains
MISRNVVLDTDHLSHVVKHFMGQGAFSYDVETVGGDFRGTPALNTVTWMGMSTTGMTVAIPFGHPIGSKVIGTVKEPRQQKNGVKMFSVPVYDDPPPQIPIGVGAELLRPLFFSDRAKVCHEATFDLGSMRKYFGEDIPGPYHDTKVIEWLLQENRPQQGLKYHTKRLYGVDYDTEEVGKCVERHPFSTVAHYQYMDALYTWLIFRDEFPRIAKQGLTGVYDLECDLIPALTRMRLRGARVDVPRLEQLRDTLTARLEVLEAACYKAAGEIFNLNSPPQKQRLLFGKKSEGGHGQGLKPWKKTDGGGWSVDSDVLESYPENALCQALMAYADTNKLLSTYVNAYLGVEGDKKKPCRVVDGLIYPEFQQHGTVTGRFSCRAPNLQNIPRPDTDDGKLIRGAFIA